MRRETWLRSPLSAKSADAEIAPGAENAGATPASARAEIMARRREKPGMVRGVAWARGVGGAESKCAAGICDPSSPIVFYILFSEGSSP